MPVPATTAWPRWASGKVEPLALMEQENAYHPHHDMTGHAERVLMTRASQAYRPDFLAQCDRFALA